MRFAGLDHEAELAVLVPRVGFTAVLQRPFDVGVANLRAQPVRVVSEAQIMVRIGHAEDPPLLLGLPVHLLRGQRRAIPIQDFDRQLYRAGDVRDSYGRGRLALGHESEILCFRGQ